MDKKLQTFLIYMYIIFSFTNIFEFLFEFNWIKLSDYYWYIYLKRKKIRISLFIILCCDPFITYLHKKKAIEKNY